MRTRHTPAHNQDGTVRPLGRRRRSRAARLATAAVATAAISAGALAGPAFAADPDVQLVPAPSATNTVLSLPGRTLLVDSQGRITGEPNFGDLSGVPLNAPVTAAAATVTGQGYWLVAADGGVFTFGDATFHGSLGNLVLNRPITAAAATPDGRGYVLVASDGGVFAFGSARFLGGLGDTKLNDPIVSIAYTVSGNGYWLAGSDGGVFAFGDAGFYGSAVDLEGRFEAIIPAPDGAGYWLVGGDGLVQGFGSAATASVTVPAGTEVASVDNLGVTMHLAVASKPAPPAPAVVSTASGPVPQYKIDAFEALAKCESGGNWAINTGNGYYGGLQFSASSWRAVGGPGLPHQNSKAEQMYRAHLLQERQGWGAWPSCSRKIGLR